MTLTHVKEHVEKIRDQLMDAKVDDNGDLMIKVNASTMEAMLDIIDGTLPCPHCDYDSNDCRCMAI